MKITFVNMFEIMPIYLDPGSGSLFIQMIIGALAGAAITLKVFWYKIKAKLTRQA